jgi:hypothetical protein
MHRHLSIHHFEFYVGGVRPAEAAAAATTTLAAAASREATLTSLSVLRVQNGQVEAEIAVANLPMTRYRLQEDLVLLKNLRRSLMERLGNYSF